MPAAAAGGVDLSHFRGAFTPNRAQRRAMGAGKVGTVNDLALSTLTDHVYLGIFEGGRVRMSAAEARATAALLVDLADVVDPPEIGEP